MVEKLTDFYSQLDWYYSQGSREEVEQFLLDAVKKVETSDGDRGQLIAIYNELGSFYRGISAFDASIGAFEMAKSITAELFGETCMQYATILNNMAGTYRLKRCYDEAIALFEEAANIYRQNGEEDSYEYASLLNNISLAFRETKQYDKAISYLSKALWLIEKMPDRHQELAITYNNLTAMHYAVGHKQEAMLCLERALREFEQCSDEENVHYAAGLNSLAALLYSEGQFDRAIEVYKKSAKYTLRFFGENVEYAITCHNMAWVYRAMGDLPAAAKVLDKAVQVCTRILGADHDRTMVAAEELKRLKKEIEK